MLLLLNKVRQDRLNDPSFGSWGESADALEIHFILLGS